MYYTVLNREQLAQNYGIIPEKAISGVAIESLQCLTDREIGELVHKVLSLSPSIETYNVKQKVKVYRNCEVIPSPQRKILFQSYYTPKKLSEDFNISIPAIPDLEDPEVYDLIATRTGTLSLTKPEPLQLISLSSPKRLSLFELHEILMFAVGEYYQPLWGTINPQHQHFKQLLNQADIDYSYN